MSDTTDTRPAATPAGLTAADLERLLRMRDYFPDFYGVIADDRESCWLARDSDGARLAVFPANGEGFKAANRRMAALERCWQAAPLLVAEVLRLQAEVAAQAAAQAAGRDIKALQAAAAQWDNVHSCLCCGRLLAWVFAGDGTYCLDVGTGQAHTCEFDLGTAPEDRTYRGQERRALRAEVEAARLRAALADIVDYADRDPSGSWDADARPVVDTARRALEEKP